MATSWMSRCLFEPQAPRFHLVHPSNSVEPEISMLGFTWFSQDAQAEPFCSPSKHAVGHSWASFVLKWLLLSFWLLINLTWAPSFLESVYNNLHVSVRWRLYFNSVNLPWPRISFKQCSKKIRENYRIQQPSSRKINKPFITNQSLAKAKAI